MNSLSAVTYIGEWTASRQGTCKDTDLAPLTAPFRNILAVYDNAVGSDDVLARAIALARTTGASLTVIKPLGTSPGSLATVAEARKRIARFVPWIVQEGVDSVHTDVLVGTPYVEISCRVLQHDHDLVIVSAEAGRCLKEMFCGTTAVNLMRKCPCAVWVVKPAPAERGSAVMAAVDAPHDSPASAINAKVLDVAVAVACAQDACLHVVHSWEVHGGEAEMLRSEIRDTTRHAILSKHETSRRDALETLLDRHRKSQVQTKVHLPRGAPHPSITTLADRLDVGLIVMGTACRVGIPGLLKGNSVERVLEAVDCDVLSVKPDDFRTPIAHP